MKVATALTATALLATSVACAAVRPEVTAAPVVKRIYRARPAKALLNINANKRDDGDDDSNDGSYDDGSNNYSNGQSYYTYKSNGHVYTVNMNDNSGSGSWGNGNHNYLTDDLLDMLPDATEADSLATLSRLYQSITADPTLSNWVHVPSVSRSISSASRAANTLGHIRHGGDGNPFDQRSGALTRATPIAGLAMIVAAGAGAMFALL
ncbi:hypothetical protein OC846_005330 [Tilletia horrida]|uniref:Uncharacterized protein n=1 Tax=Tilletia horrida TaxID=155126 RepID=A0AAN6GL18_9BASI|nr:hypothetical protein OC846_005330 [Tilletia horrida]